MAAEETQVVAAGADAVIVLKFDGELQLRSLRSVGWIDPDSCEWYFELETMGL